MSSADTEQRNPYVEERCLHRLTIGGVKLELIQRTWRAAGDCTWSIHACAKRSYYGTGLFESRLWANRAFIQQARLLRTVHQIGPQR